MATFREQLSKLEELGVSAQCTIQTLQSNDGDDFAREIVNQVYQKVADKNTPEELNDEEGSVLDSKLLFLEELLQEPEEVQAQVKGWLSDAKRRFLFDYSPQAQLYGELLLAKAKGTLEEFIRNRNPKISSPDKFVYEQELHVNFDPANEPDKESSYNLIKMKLEAVIQNIVQDYKKKPRRERFSDGNFLDLREVWNRYDKLDEAARTTFGGLKEICRKEVLMYRQQSAEQQMDLSYPETLISKLGESLVAAEQDDLGREIQFGFDWSGDLFTEEVDVLTVRLEEAILNVKSQLEQKAEKEEDGIIQEETETLRSGVRNVDDAFYGVELSPGNLLPTPAQRAELRAVHEELQNNLLRGEDNLCDRFGKPKLLEYSIQLESKDPLDLKLGNDSGCCIGVYENTKQLGNAYGLPQMLVDNSIHFFGIYQKINGGKERRVGLVLAFQALDSAGNKVLAGNSIELSPRMNPISVVPQVVKFIEEALRDFSIKNCYRTTIMSTHDYNTSYNFSQRKAEKCSGLGKLTKPHASPQEPFYSEIVSNKNPETIDTEEGFYRIY